MVTKNTLTKLVKRFQSWIPDRIVKFVKTQPYTAALLLVWGTYFLTLFPRMIALRPSGLWVGHLNVWSDWALHIGMSTLFAEKPPSEWFAYHPMYADGRFTYPFLTNLISGLLMRAGLSLPLSFILPSMVFSIFLLLGMHRLLTLTLKSEAKSFCAISIFFLGEGLGGIDFIKEFIKHPSLEMLLYPPLEYGRLDDHGWFSGNFITGILIPQRSSLLGMPIALWSLYLLFSTLLSPKLSAKKANRRLIFGGLLAGLLPITHMHSFMATVLIAAVGCLKHFRAWKKLCAYVVPAGVLSTFLYLKFVYGGIENPNFMSFVPGYAAKGVRDWFYFWTRCWGFILPVALLGVWTLRKRIDLTRHALLISAWVLFIFGNLVQTQPINWDNSKLFMWSYLGLSALCTEFIFHLWKRPGNDRVIAICIVIGLTFTGVLETVRLQRTDRNQQQVMNAQTYALADQVRRSTPSLARFLTETSHNHWVMVRAARPILMGFVAWVWNFGFVYQNLENDIKPMYSGTPEGEALLKKHRVSFVVIGPGETYNFHPNEEAFKARFPLAFSNSEFRVYDVRQLLSP